MLHDQREHILPRTLGGPDISDNMVLACRGCNSLKGVRDIFEWYGKERQYERPRLALSKYLKRYMSAPGCLTRPTSTPTPGSTCLTSVLS